MSKKYLRELAEVLHAMKNETEIEEFLEAILTPKELVEIPKRLQIIKLLKKGVPQREITEQLGVGIATVTRGSIAIKSKGFRELEFS